MRKDHPNLEADAVDPREEHQAPGGAKLNRASGVATSAVLGGASAGALAGAVAGPVGAAVGAAVGAVAAGFAGNAVMENIDTKVEEEYWRENFSRQPYVDPDADFDDYGPAYRYGLDGYVRYQGRSFDEAEAELSQGWAESRGASGLDWDEARHASRDGWHRVAVVYERAAPGSQGSEER